MENSIYLKSIPFILEDHGSKLLKALYEQQKKAHLCDLSLVVENVSFPAHKCVLAAYSGYFCALFDQGKQSDNAGSKACNVTTIHLSSITLNTFIPILHYLYTSQLHIFSENIREIMRTARKLQISSILNACEKLLDDNIALPSINKVTNKQSSDTIVTQSNLSESVLYVDLRSEDDDRAYQPSQSAPSYTKTADSIEQSVQAAMSYTVNQSSSAKQKMGRTQKKGFPKKIQRSPSTNAIYTSEQTGPPVHSISATVSPASIFGRVSAIQSSRTKSLTSSPVTSIMSLENANKSSIPSNSIMESLPFEGNLEALGAIFGPDSSLIMDGMQNENLSTSSTLSDKPPTVVLAKTSTPTDPMQHHSVFSMSPKSSHKATMSSGEWSRFHDAISSGGATVSSVLPAAVPSATLLPSSNSVLQSPLACPPAVYSCKECFKYFTNLPDALHHFYTEHQTLATGSKPSTSPQKNPKPSTSHACPHCGRVFNNKNNLKRHILIKHTSDKRFKCSVCGRRYAIRQSLQYHMKSVHGNVLNEAQAEVVRSRSATSPTMSAYPFEPIASREPINSLTDTFSFSVTASNTSSNLLDTFQHISTRPTITSPAAYLTNPSMRPDGMADTSHTIDKNDINMPTIQRIESIRSVMENVEKANGKQQTNKKKERKPKSVNSSSKSLQGYSGAFPMASGATLPAILPQFPLQSSAKESPSQKQNSEVTPRLHRCDHCSRIFSTIHAYTRHRRSCHKHECPICHRGFSQMGNMRRHIKIFHCELKPYQCHICHKAYGIKQSFRYHMRDKHGSVDLPKSMPKQGAGQLMEGIASSQLA